MRRYLEVLALILIAFIASAQILQTSGLPLSTGNIAQGFDGELPPVRTVNLSFQVQKNHEWTEMNISATENIENQSLAQFKGTFYNDGETDAIVKSFEARMFNSTWLVANYTYDFPFGGTNEIRISPYVSKTQNLSTTLIFPDKDQSYLFQIGFNYVLTSNRSLELFAGYTGNYTVNMGIRDIPPPELLVISFYIVSFLILLHLGIGIYGSRKQKEETKNPKYAR